MKQNALEREWSVSIEPAICKSHLPSPWDDVGGRGERGVGHLGWGSLRVVFSKSQSESCSES